MIEFSLVNLKGIDYLAHNLSEIDKAEVKAYSGNPPKDAIMQSYAKSSECYLAYFKGSEYPFAIFGVASFDYEGKHGAPWLLTTGEADREPMDFLKESKLFIDKWSDYLESLVVDVHAENERSQKWLRWLGFEHINTVTMNNGERFFTMRLDNENS